MKYILLFFWGAVAGPDLPIGMVGNWPRTHGYRGATETNLSRKNDPLMSLAEGPQVGNPALGSRILDIVLSYKH